MRLIAMVASLMIWTASTSQSYAQGDKAVDPKEFKYTEANHKACQKTWPEPCGMQNDKNGDMILCLSQDKNLKGLTNSCFGVLLEISTWAPKNCVQEMNKNCPAGQSAFSRIDCAAFNAAKFGKECNGIVNGLGRIAKEYRRRTKMKN